MSFGSYLKRLFIYSGEETNSDVGKEDEVSEPVKKDFLTNPIKRAKIVKEDAVNKVNAMISSSKPSVTEYTKGLIYKSLAKLVEREVNLGKPTEEVCLLFKRFLEDKVTDESLYSEYDLKYIYALTVIIKGFKSSPTYEGNIQSDIKSSRYFLNIIEVLDLYYGTHIMKYCCVKDYILCGCSYGDNKSVMLGVKESNENYFSIRIGDTFFYLLSNVKSIINEDSTEEEKIAYVSNRIKHLFDSCISSGVINVRDMLISYLLFSGLEVDNPEDIREDNLCVSDPIDVIVDDNPVNVLKSESEFAEKYHRFYSPVEMDISLQEITDALEEIENMFSKEGVKPTETQEEYIKVIKMKRDMILGKMQ